MKKKRTFWDDPTIGPKLDAIPENEMSTIIRMALRQWFGTTGKTMEVITAQQVARELIANLKTERSAGNE